MVPFGRKIFKKSIRRADVDLFARRIEKKRRDDRSAHVINQRGCDGKLRGQHQRNAQTELCLSGFVVKDAHADQSARSGEQAAGSQQRFFGNAADAAYGFALVEAHQEECGQIGQRQRADKIPDHSETFLSGENTAIYLFGGRAEDSFR